MVIQYFLYDSGALAVIDTADVEPPTDGQVITEEDYIYRRKAMRLAQYESTLAQLTQDVTDTRQVLDAYVLMKIPEAVADRMSGWSVAVAALEAYVADRERFLDS